VHSRTVRDLARAAGYDRPISVIPHPAWPVPRIAAARVAEGPVVGCFGVVNASKRIPELLRAFAAVRRDVPDATLLLVGPTSPGFDLDRRLQRLGLDADGLVREDWVDEARLWSLMAGVDVCVNLRHPTMGETSGSVIRSLSLGKPLVVSDVGWFSELPDRVAAKVPVGPGEVGTLTAFLDALASDEELRRKMGRAAAEYARQEHDLDRTADLYVAALEEAAGGLTVRDELAGELARSAWEVGLGARNPQIGDIAAKARELGVGF
jgi:glycosyltransferase involved in cell wall biosynthesis